MRANESQHVRIGAIRRSARLLQIASNHRQSFLLGAGIALGLSGVVSTPSFAAPADTTVAATDADAGSALEEITVTARRRNENLQNVPIAVTAFSPKELEEKHIQSAVDLATFSPSMVSGTVNSNSDAPTFAIRGQATTQFGAPGVVAYFAEVPLSFFGLSPIDGRPGTYYDLNNVQVLNGPQGTLFGKNATGGSVLFVPKPPSEDFGGYIQAEGGNFNDKRFQGAVNIPLISDKVLLRIAGEVDRREGYVKDMGPYFPGKDYNNVHDESVRASLIIRPFEGLENYTILRYYNEDTNGPGYYLSNYNPGASNGVLSALYPGIGNYLTQSLANGVYRTATDVDQRDRYKYWQAINTTTYALTPALKVKNIASYSQDRDNLNYNLSAAPFPLFEITTPPGQYYNGPNLFTEELQLQGSALAEALTYTAGVYYDRQTNSATKFDSILLPLNLFFNNGNESAPLDTLAYFETDSHAAFSQATYDFGKLSSTLEGLSVTAGYRYTWETVTSSYFLDKVPGQGPAINSNTFDYGSYTFGVDYKFSPSLMAYVSARSAAKSGGSNLYEPNGSPYLNFAPERLKDVEIGLKSQFHVGDMLTRANIAAYHGQYSNIQRTVEVVYNDVPAFVTLNTSNAFVKGVEFQGDISPVKNLTFLVSYSYIDSAYTGVTDVGAVSLLGGMFPFTPRNKATLGASYNVPLSADLGTLGFNATYTFQSREAAADTIPSSVPFVPGFERLINARLSWSGLMNTPLDLAFFVTNAANEKYITSVNDGYYKPFGTVSLGYGEPRMYGAQLTYRFGSNH